MIMSAGNCKDEKILVALSGYLFIYLFVLFFGWRGRLRGLKRASDVDEIIKTGVAMNVSPSGEFADQIEFEVADGLFFFFFFFLLIFFS